MAQSFNNLSHPLSFTLNQRTTIREVTTKPSTASKLGAASKLVLSRGDDLDFFGAGCEQEWRQYDLRPILKE